VHSVFYSAPARLIGHRLRVHVYDDRIEAWLGATRVVVHPRRRARDGGKRVHQVDYRQVIHALRRKPFRRRRTSGSTGAGALDLWRQPLPARRIRRSLDAALGDPAREGSLPAHRRAPRTRPRRGLRGRTRGARRGGLAAGRAPDARDLRDRLEPRQLDLPADVPVALTELACFDALLEARA
jgi:hypothetical protein